MIGSIGNLPVQLQEPDVKKVAPIFENRTKLIGSDGKEIPLSSLINNFDIREEK